MKQCLSKICLNPLKDANGLLPLAEFGKDKNRKDGLNYYCKVCKNSISAAEYNKNKDSYQSRAKVKRILNPRSFRENQWRYIGIKNPDGSQFKWQDYLQLLAKQENKCGVCNKSIDISSHADHNHKTNIIRGLLCHKCNTALGLLEDNIASLYFAIEYLQGPYVK